MARTQLTDHLTLNATKSGNDSTGDGSVASPFLTIQHAINVVYENYDTGGEYWVKIQVGDGTWEENLKIAYPLPGAGPGSYLRLSGNVSTPGNCLLKPASGVALEGTYGAYIEFEGFRFEAPTYGVSAYNGAVMSMTGKCDFGPCGYHVYSFLYGSVKLFVPYDISGGAVNHFIANCGSISLKAAANLTQSNLNFSGCFIQGDRVADINLRGASFTGQTANVTGKRWAADGNATIRTSAGVNPDTLIPGSVNGTKTLGGEAG